jgi:Na+:H+ antiporter, NhaA family
MTKKLSPKKQGRKRRAAPLVLMGAALVATVALSAWYFASPRREAGALAVGERGAEPARALGPESAPVVLEEFGDYQCPPCAQVFPEVEAVRREYGERLRFVFRHYPVTSLHPHALLAAHAAEAAGLQGKFWEMHRALYENQQIWTRTPDPRPLFENYARGLRLDVERFRRDLGGRESDERVVADHARARSLGVEAAPTFFLNGRRLPPASGTGRELRSQINRELAK